MDNKELILQLSKKLRISQVKTQERLNLFTNEIITNLLSDNNVEFLNFGDFEKKLKGQKVIFNPKAGRKMLYPPRNTVELEVSGSFKKHLKTIEK